MAEETIILLFCGCCSVGVAVTMANLFDFAGGNRFLEQNIVILTASLQPLYEQAESLFIEAAAQFECDNDRLRHLVNLLHLYLD